MGLRGIAELTHALESLLDRVRTGSLAPTASLTSSLLRGTDDLRLLLDSIRENPVQPAVAPASVMAELEEMLGPAPPPSAVGGAIEFFASEQPREPTEYEIRFRPEADVYRTGLDPLLLLRELANMGELREIRADLGQLPPLPELDPERSYLGWTLRVKTEQSAAQLREVFAFVEQGSELQIMELSATATPDQRPAESELAEPRGRTSGFESSTIRVSIEKVDRLINLVGELVIAQSMISQVAEDLSPDKLLRLQEAVGQMERNTRELQERVMAVRMVPLSTVLSRLPRLVRDTAEALDKKVKIQITGGETEIDKGVIERLGDPLTHLVRNAVDHGIESPRQRVAAGKPAQGTLELLAFHQGGNVMIRVQDDGRGLDTEKIRRKAIALGLIAANAEPTAEDLAALIFHPGLSTADSVSDISGRGVGMDVVKTNIESLGGTISIDSVAGRGTRVQISLPLTLAIIDGLCVGLGSEVYVLPLVSIVESFRLQRSDLRTVVGRGEVVCVRGQVLPLVRLRRLLSVPTRVEAPSDGIVVIIENHGTPVGLLVDEIQGQSQVVIKSLETNYGRVEGVMGATIMGDGRVALILDVQALARVGQGAPERRAEA